MTDDPEVVILQHEHRVQSLLVARGSLTPAQGLQNLHFLVGNLARMGETALRKIASRILGEFPEKREGPRRAPTHTRFNRDRRDR